MLKDFHVSPEEKERIEQLIEGFREQLAGGRLFTDPAVVCCTFEKLLHPEQCHLYEVNTVLRLVSEGERLVIDACNGKGGFTEGGGFTFVNDIHLGGDRTDKATKKREVEVYQAKVKATNAVIFKSVGVELDKLCLTEHQGESFFRKYYQYLPGGDHTGPTIFLRKKGEDYFVIRVFIAHDARRLAIREDRLFGGRALPAGSCVVIPKFVV